MLRGIFALLLIVTLLLPCGCASALKPSLAYQPGAMVETLSATASLSISKGEQGMAGNGYLLYQRPDRMRMVILSPFGTTMMEAIVSGRRITIISNSKGEAFSGSLEELPLTGQGETWRHARWVMETDLPALLLVTVRWNGSTAWATGNRWPSRTGWSSPRAWLTAIWCATGITCW